MEATLLGGPFHGETANVIGRETLRFTCGEGGMSRRLYRWRVRVSLASDRMWFGVHSSLTEAEAEKLAAEMEAGNDR